MNKGILADFLANLKRFVRGERAPRPDPILCTACREPVFGDGYSFRGEPYCSSLCVPTFFVGNAPNLAGDPR